MTPAQYELLERAIIGRQRVAIFRRAGELVVVPTALRTVRGRERIDVSHPTSGEAISIALDDIEAIELVE